MYFSVVHDPFGHFKGAVIVKKNGVEKQLPLDQTAKHGKGSPTRAFGSGQRETGGGFPFFSLSASRYFGDKETLCLYWPLATVVIAGPKVLDFYAGFRAHRATCLKADGKDIKVLNLIISGNPDDARETDPSKDLKPEK